MITEDKIMLYGVDLVISVLYSKVNGEDSTLNYLVLGKLTLTGPSTRASEKDPRWRIWCALPDTRKISDMDTDKDCDMSHGLRLTLKPCSRTLLSLDDSSVGCREETLRGFQEAIAIQHYKILFNSARREKPAKYFFLAE